MSEKEHSETELEKSGLGSSRESPGLRSLNDVAFEEYLHYAAIQRRTESIAPNESKDKAEETKWYNNLSKHKGPNINVDTKQKYPDVPMTPEQEELAAASRAMRLASWASIFYLVTTDILGPFNAAYAIASVGWVPGVLLYSFMAAIAWYSSVLLWRLFLRLDSLRYPLRTYSDVMERIYGKRARQLTSVLQTIQLMVVVAVNILSSGQALSQVTQKRVCFSICILIWTLVGMAVSQIRSLKNYAWVSTVAVWINITIICTSMGFIANSPPNFAAAQQSLGVPLGPVMTLAKTNLPLFSQVTGAMNMVYAYGGAMMFFDMMAEMRRPMDFWKGMTLAQLVIFIIYIVYGTFVYSFQGQFSLPLAYQGVSRFSWQSVGNVLSMFSLTITSGLCGNIGTKIVYRTVTDRFRGESQLTPRNGYFIWSGLVCLYWSIAFVVGSSIPQVQTISALITSIAIMQFTYTFPPLLRLGYDVITDAMAADSQFVPGTGTSGRVDGWHQWSRWKRGLFSGRVYFKIFNLLLALGGLAVSCLGMWGSGKSIKAIFDTSGSATSFGCVSPV